jgi:DNA-binding transcriptional ArsR family regulator
MLISMEDEMLLRALRALSDPTRLHIVEFLSSCCCGRAAVRDDGGVEGPTAGEVCCHITGVDKVSSTISHHLHELEDAGLVCLERKGRATQCTLRPAGLLAVAKHLERVAKGIDSGSCC